MANNSASPKPQADPIALSDGTVVEPNPAQTCAEAEAVPARPRASWPLVVLATIVVLAVLYVASDVFVPIVFALLLALLFRPVQRRMKRWQIPNGVSALIVVAVIAVVYVAAILGLAGQAQRWLAEAPQMVRSVKEMLPANIGGLSDLKETSDAVGELADEKAGGEDGTSEAKSQPPAAPASQPSSLAAGPPDWVFTVIGVSGHFLGASVIVLVLVYFLLALGDQLTNQAVEIMPSFGEKRNVVQLVHNVEQGISRYLATISVINIGLGVATAATMWVMDIPNPILWGVMAATLNYVPHVGAFICQVVLFLVGTIAHQSLAYGITTAVVFAVLTSAESYIITPMVLSKSLQVSPLAIILAILFGGWMWGISGGLLAAPLITVIKIICDQFESMRPAALFLSGETTSDQAKPSPEAPAPAAAAGEKQAA